jgi:hypothetical protein
MTAWVAFDPVMPFRIPKSAGVYAIYLNGELVYVGQSNNLLVRLSRHRIRHGYSGNLKTPWGEFPGETHLTGKLKVSRVRGDWAMWEIRLIERLMPKFNRTFVSRRSA